MTTRPSPQMSPDDFAVVLRLFNRICDWPLVDQRQAIDQAQLSAVQGQRLAAMLEGDRASEPDAFRQQVERAAVSLASGAKERVGPYQLIMPLGQGAAGEVYLAERVDGAFEMQVAIKFLSTAGIAAEKLIQRERQVMARLQHPGIARLLDAGEHERLGAYLVMDCVSGRPIDRYVAENRLPWRRILQLMVEAGQAVAAAHRSLVLHRDLKPDHLMISPNGSVKILDFGVSAILESSTQDQALTQSGGFTPRYAAPEQIIGQATQTGTDVYALALIAAELLCEGAHPFGEDAHQQAARKLRGEDQLASLLSQAILAPRARRSLLAVLRRGLAVSPEARYASSDAFCADLQAVLDDRPVAVRRATMWESMAAWVQRNRATAAGLAFAALALLAATVFAGLAAHRETTERQRATAAALQSQAVADFLVELFASADPGAVPGEALSAFDLLGRATEHLDAMDFADDALRARLSQVIGSSWMGLGNYPQAEALLREAITTGDDNTVGKATLTLARLHNRQGEYDHAVALIDGANRSRWPADDQASLWLTLATAQLNLGDPASAREAALAAMAVAEGDDPKMVAQSMLGTIAFTLEDYVEAEQRYEAVLAERTERQGPDHAETAMSYNNLAGIYYVQGDLQRAADNYRRAADAFEAHFGVVNRSVAMAQRNLGVTLRRLGDAAPAEAALRKAYQGYRDWQGPENHDAQEAAVQLAELLIVTGRVQQARELLTGLPPSNLNVGRGHTTACRIDALMAVWERNLPRADCVQDVDVPENTQLIAQYLAVLQNQRPAALAELLAAVVALHPADPLFEQRLQP